MNYYLLLPTIEVWSPLTHLGDQHVLNTELVKDEEKEQSSFLFNNFSYSTSTFMILISSKGLSVLLAFAFSIACTTSSPDKTRPKIVCFLSSQGVVVVVIKNWEPLVFGPALAILTVYGLLKHDIPINNDIIQEICSLTGHALDHLKTRLQTPCPR
jgi:hypothetical protein